VLRIQRAGSASNVPVDGTAGPATLFLMTDREFLLRIDHLREETRN